MPASGRGDLSSSVLGLTLMELNNSKFPLTAYLYLIGGNQGVLHNLHNSSQPYRPLGCHFLLCSTIAHWSLWENEVVSTCSLYIWNIWQDPKCSLTRGIHRLRNFLKVRNHIMAYVNHFSLLLSLFFLWKKLKQPEYPSVNEWLNYCMHMLGNTIWVWCWSGIVFKSCYWMGNIGTRTLNV